MSVLHLEHQRRLQQGQQLLKRLRDGVVRVPARLHALSDRVCCWDSDRVCAALRDEDELELELDVSALLSGVLARDRDTAFPK